MGVTKHPLFFGPGASAHVAADVELARRLRQSFTALAARGNELAERFYALLFARHPQVRPLFPADLSEQHEKLMHTLTAIVDAFEMPAKNAELLREMGRRHEGYGARNEHYPAVTSALVEAMREIAGASWNDELELDWRTALEQISAAMTSAARS